MKYLKMAVVFAEGLVVFISVFAIMFALAWGINDLVSMIPPEGKFASFIGFFLAWVGTIKVLKHELVRREKKIV